MFNFKSLLNKALCALMLAVAAGGALAGPTYHVSVNTTSLAAKGSGNLDFSLGNLVGAAETIVTLSNFSGAFGGEADRLGNVTGAIPGTVVLRNVDELSFLTQSITLGGLFGFDVSFSGAFATTGGADGTTFSVSLFDQAMSDYLAFDFVNFEVVPAFGAAPSQILTRFDEGLANVGIAAEVPEPSELLLMLTGLALMGAMLRRRAG